MLDQWQQPQRLQCRPLPSNESTLPAWLVPAQPLAHHRSGSCPPPAPLTPAARTTAAGPAPNGSAAQAGPPPLPLAADLLAAAALERPKQHSPQQQRLRRLRLWPSWARQAAVKTADLGQHPAAQDPCSRPRWALPLLPSAPMDTTAAPELALQTVAAAATTPTLLSSVRLPPMQPQQHSVCASRLRRSRRSRCVQWTSGSCSCFRTAAATPMRAGSLTVTSTVTPTLKLRPTATATATTALLTAATSLAATAAGPQARLTPPRPRLAAAPLPQVPPA